MAKKEKKKDKEKDRDRDKDRNRATRKDAVLAAVKFTRKNTMLFGIGLVLIVAGFVLLAAGDITVAPVLLVVGYLVFFPLGILLK